MASPSSNMATTLNASLEQSFQKCSLNNSARSLTSSSSSSKQDEASQNHPQNTDDIITIELNSHIFLPYHWEQYLDLKTGEIYYINWTNGMKTKEDPRTILESDNGEDYYYSEEEEDSSYDGDQDSSSESSPSPSTF